MSVIFLPTENNIFRLIVKIIILSLINFDIFLNYFGVFHDINTDDVNINAPPGKYHHCEQLVWLDQIRNKLGSNTVTHRKREKGPHK